jgi:hypothetical protein
MQQNPKNKENKQPGNLQGNPAAKKPGNNNNSSQEEQEEDEDMVQEDIDADEDDMDDADPRSEENEENDLTVDDAVEVEWEELSTISH